MPTITRINQAIIMVHEALQDLSFSDAPDKDEKLAVLYMRESSKHLKKARGHLETSAGQKLQTA